MRRLALPLLVLVALLATCATALGHAELASTSPSADARLSSPPARVVASFTEPVQLLRPDDLQVVDEDGVPVVTGAARPVPGDATSIAVPLRPGLPEGTYTVRFSVIGADSHVIPGLFVFGVGNGELAAPYSGGEQARGPSETSAWGVSARFLERLGLGGLIGLLLFRWLVWRPAVRRTAMDDDERARALTWGRDAFWVGFGVLAVVAMLAEGYLLVVQSASVLGTSVAGALGDAQGISQVLGGSRFGTLVQLRGALLFGVFAIGAWQFMSELGSTGAPRPATVSGRLAPALLMAGLLGAVLWSLSTQGHATVARFSEGQVVADLLHMVSVSVWIVGLAMVALIMRRAPAVAPGGGPTLAARVLSRFSQVALVAVGVAVLTGVSRSIGELGDPSELWATAYGRSILIKIGLLIPIALMALHTRRVIEALRAVPRPNAATLRLVRRNAGAELALSLAIVLVASLLVAQVPGGA